MKSGLRYSKRENRKISVELTVEEMGTATAEWNRKVAKQREIYIF